MIATIITVVSYVLIGLIIGIAFWVGYRRGVKRSAIISGITFGLILVAFFVTPSISTAILKIQVGFTGSPKPLSQIIIDAVSSSEAMQTAIENSPSLKAFLEALPTVAVNVVVFLLLYAIIRLLGYIIYKIIEHTCLKSKKEEKELGLKRNRWAGAGINTAKALLFAFIAFAPITALLGFVDDIQKETEAAYNESASSETSYYYVLAEEESEEGTTENVLPTLPDLNNTLFDKIPSFAMDGISAYNNNILGKVGGFLGMDNIIFDGLTKIKSNGETINFRQDALNYVTVYNTVKKACDAANASQDNAFKNVDWDKIDKIAYEILDSGLVKGLGANVAADVIKNYEQFDFVDLSRYTEILDAIKVSLQNKDAKQYFSNDFKNIYQVISNAGRSGMLDTIIKDKSNTKVLVDHILVNANKTPATNIVDNVFSLNLLKDAAAPATKFVLEGTSYNEFSLNNSVTGDWNAFKLKIKSVVSDAFDINDKTAVMNLIDDPLLLIDIEEDNVDEILSKVGNIIDNLNSILKTEDDKTVADKFLEQVDMENLLSVRNEEINNYKDLMEYLSSPVKKLVSFRLYNEIKHEAEFNEILEKISKNLADNSTETTYSTALTDIVSSLYKVDGFRTKVFDKIVESTSGSMIIDFSTLNVIEAGELNFEKSYANWTNDTKNISALLVEFNKIKVTKDGQEKTLFDWIITEEEDFSEIIKLIPTEKLNKILKPVTYTISTRSLLDNSLQTIVETLNDVADISATINLNAITLKENASEDQSDEICAITTKMVEIYKESASVSSYDDLSYAQIGSLLDKLKENAYRVNLKSKTEAGLFKEVFDGLYDKLLDTYPDAVDIIGDTPRYEINFTTLMEIVESIQDAEENSFIDDLAEILSSDTVTVDDINTMIDKIGLETTEEDIETINTLLDNIEDLGIDVITEDTATVIEENKDSIIETLNNNDNIPQETKDKILAFLGLAGEE